MHATGTRNMEEMGGLIRRMPATALYFLIGAIAISGLPPLNGFVSEWLTYQALLAGFGATDQLTRLAFPIAGALLALTAALAAACFVKAFGITFLALPRSEDAEHAHEVPHRPCRPAWRSWLAGLCVVLGLGATWFLPVFDPITQQRLRCRRQRHLVAANGLVLTAGIAHARQRLHCSASRSCWRFWAPSPSLFWFVWGRDAPSASPAPPGTAACPA